jgi:magnesium chelatase subunit D
VRAIAELAVELDLDGHRADLVILRAAAALAAFDGRRAVTPADARRAAALALPHRLRRRPFDQHGAADDRLAEAMQRWEPGAEGPVPAGSEGQESRGDGSAPRVRNPIPDGDAIDPQDSAPQADGPTHNPVHEPMPIEPAGAIALPRLDAKRDRARRGASGRRLTAPSSDARGRAVRATLPSGPVNDLAIGATIRAAARQIVETGTDRVALAPLHIPDSALRSAVRERALGAGIIFIVDASGSMGARRRMAAAKGAALTLLTEAYQRRDRVALIAFRGASAELLLPLTNSVELVHRRLAELPTGGRTPLAAGLGAALDLIRQTRLKDSRLPLIPVVITDGRANSGPSEASPMEEALQAAALLRLPGVHPLVLDAEHGRVNLGFAAQLAERAGARYVRLADLSPENVAASVQALAAESIG